MTITRRNAWFAAMALLMAVPLAGVTGCTTTQSPKEQVSDNSIHAKLKAKLTEDRFSNITNVDINVTNGIVTLAGEVPNSKVREDAEREAWSVKGVRQVINNLQVQTTGTGASSPHKP